MVWLLTIVTATALAAAWASVRLCRARMRPSFAPAHRRRGAPPDPVDALVLQMRLGELSTELLRIEQDPAVFARAHHSLAVQAAYDAVLREACRLAGLAVEDAPLRADLRSGDEERFREELELSARGWSW